MIMKRVSQHIEWLSLIEVTGPFLTVSALERAFPQGLESVETPKRQRLRAAYEEWSEAVDDNDPQLLELHREWVRFVLEEILEYDDEVLIPNSELDRPFSLSFAERIGSFAPDLVVLGGKDEKPRLMISIQNPGTDLESVQQGDGWSASPIERMVMLCRDSGVRLGLVTNGERWTVVNAPEGQTSGHASWYARLWNQEWVTLKAFQSLLGVRRCFGPVDETLDALLEESLKHQDEVTYTLGEQVRRAVEVLIQCLDKADEDRNRELLRDVQPAELYEAGLTVMMRLVFILCAEERGLLLLGDPVYDQCYAISTLRAQLEEEAERHGPEVLDRRYDAWARLLSVFRAVYGGIEHESLRMPALGGSLFDPDRYPFLEGRTKGTYWKETTASPLPIDNRTVLLLLNSLQVLEQSGGALLLSYRSLDVEQIGHVYEGLLEHTVVRVPQITLGLVGSQNAKNPNLPLSELESAYVEGTETLVRLLQETTQRSESAIRHALDRSVDEVAFSHLLTVCEGDTELAERIRPFVYLLRTDAWGEPILYRENAFMVTLGADRRETGTHYTPKALTESIVTITLEPLVYLGPEEGKPREQWVLKSSAHLLDLKICDPAMGSGAFLVQACRWLSERLVEAWDIEEASGKVITVEGEARQTLDDNVDPMPVQLDERLLIAKRLIAERCLYGVDVNPLAVELAKLSIWLVTMAKNRPFGFLDHNLRHGDSLVGIYRLDQLTKLSLAPDEEHRVIGLFARNIEEAVNEAVELRQMLRKIPIRDIHDVEAMSQLEKEARNKLQGVELLADAIIGEYLRSRRSTREFEVAQQTLSYYAEELFNGNEKLVLTASSQARIALSGDLSDGKLPRKFFHWPLEFPEVFTQLNGGFDAIVGNPPFMGGRRMRAALGDRMMDWLTVCWSHASLNADLCAFFYLRGGTLLHNHGEFGLLATKSIGQTDTARTGLAYLVGQKDFTIRYALSSFSWPGSASVTAALVVCHNGKWNGLKFLDGQRVETISPALDDQSGWGKAQPLSANKESSFIGSMLSGKGFILTDGEMRDFLNVRPANQQAIKPYLVGEDINTHPEQKASRWAIDFRDASLLECESKWPELLERVRLLVKPERDVARAEAHRKYWWQHGRTRPALYERIKDRSEVFVISRVTKYVAIARVSAKQIFSDAVCVFDLPSWAHFAALQCSYHEMWVRRESSTMKRDIRYTPSDSFDTYPFLHINDDFLESIGQSYHDFRQTIMKTRNIGLTAVYNLFHNPDEWSDDIQKLRELHVKMDQAVANVYGWYDLDMKHGFYETRQGVRYTLCETACREVLERLLELNHECYEKEMNKDRADKEKDKLKTTRRSKKSKVQDTQLNRAFCRFLSPCRARDFGV
ncbi:transcriptional regulator, TetR family [Alicyclobacillus hesperidum URH17-3-68]|uniref:Eco57I restriction-modification methylase domain-containing protein n=1 Tax=Alicyclobacillus hesperidum TaxID=89784 RepID=UPI000281B313|nr:DNA methyltransferase [Alicyclobacillus hesperidum]EJY55742.1 transcriptional regulator, TetR family [Alicyclobacillus hesperidum URH17-3-68]